MFSIQSVFVRAFINSHTEVLIVDLRKEGRTGLINSSYTSLRGWTKLLKIWFLAITKTKFESGAQNPNCSEVL